MKAQKGRYYTVTEAAEALCISVGRVRQLILAGRIPAASKAGNMWLIKAPLKVLKAGHNGGTPNIPPRAYIRKPA